MSQPDQSFDNHAKLVPVFHGTLAFMIMVPMLYFVYLAVTDFSVERLVFALFMVGALSMGWHARLFPLRVQDRLIRLEEQLRLHRILPGDQQGRIGDINTDLLIGLRFAPDDEVADLVRRILEGEIADRKAVKQAVKNWRADNQRI
ncbi:MAG TPA: hypothetical protein EYQ27_20115 [Gemmatimonadetes bacterium]|nr:hypothetical protein [Gemmatimonadota bacterium]